MEENVSPKIIAAITSALSAYREEKRVLQEKQKDIIKSPIQTEKVNLWAIAGRQEVVFQRRLWQMRMY